jgi:hypothetical protein
MQHHPTAGPCKGCKQAPQRPSLVPGQCQCQTAPTHLKLAPVAQASCCTELVGPCCLHRAECDALGGAAKLAADVSAAATNPATDINHLQSAAAPQPGVCVWGGGGGGCLERRRQAGIVAPSAYNAVAAVDERAFLCWQSAVETRCIIRGWGGTQHRVVSGKAATFKILACRKECRRLTATTWRPSHALRLPQACLTSAGALLLLS